MPEIADRLNRRLARLLAVGTWAACGLIAIGMALPWLAVSLRPRGPDVVAAGTALLIALPALRVAVMGVWFARHRDLEFALVAAAVLAIIAASTLLGARAP